MSRVLDTSVLVDFLTGDARARKVVLEATSTAVSALTWLEVMVAAPADCSDATRAFLGAFERLSISEAVADEALLLRRRHPDLDERRALTWACARVNRADWVTSDTRGLGGRIAGVVVPYRRGPSGSDDPAISAARRP